MKNQAIKRVSFSIFIALALIVGLVSPAFAATQLTVKVLEVVPGGLVRLEVSGMPSGTEFAVRMGASGSKGVGGWLIAHFNSGGGGTQQYWFEIHVNVRNNSFVDVRVEGDGYFGFASFDNKKTTTGGGTVVSPTPVPPSTGGPTTPPVTGSSKLQVVASQKGGWVKVAAIGLKANTTFTVRIGMAGTRAANGLGYVVAHFDTDGAGNAVGTYEVPFALRDQTTLDFRAEATGAVYVITFSNVDK